MEIKEHLGRRDTSHARMSLTTGRFGTASSKLFVRDNFCLVELSRICCTHFKQRYCARLKEIENRMTMKR